MNDSWRNHAPCPSTCSCVSRFIVVLMRCLCHRSLRRCCLYVDVYPLFVVVLCVFVCLTNLVSSLSIAIARSVTGVFASTHIATADAAA